MAYSGQRGIVARGSEGQMRRVVLGCQRGFGEGTVVCGGEGFAKMDALAMR